MSHTAKQLSSDSVLVEATLPALKYQLLEKVNLKQLDKPVKILAKLSSKLALECFTVLSLLNLT